MRIHTEKQTKGKHKMKDRYEKLVFTDWMESWLVWGAFPKMTVEMVWWASDYLGGQVYGK
jgi:hypothetical protein